MIGNPVVDNAVPRCALSPHLSKPQKTSVLLMALLSIAISACTTTTPAPIVDRNDRTSRSAPPQPIPPSRPAPIDSRDSRSAPPSTSDVTAQPAPSSGVTIGAAPSTTINERSAPPSTVPGAPVAGNLPGNTPGSQFHVVQRGETLYRIAVNNNLNVESLAAWNNLSPITPNIREGQVLRLRPPEGGLANVTPIDPRSAPPGAQTGAPLVVQPDGSVLPSTPTPAAPSAPLKTEPRAQRLPYSDSALAQMQRSDGNIVPQSTTSPSPQPSNAASAPSASGAPSDPARAAPPASAGAQPLAGEPEFKPGAGIERDGVTWTWPTTGRLASRWNERAAMKGVDIATKGGTPVVAAAAGKVIYVGKEPRGNGQMIVVSHAKETVSVYFHTDKVTVKEQQRVTLGQRMAEVTESAENKMHFEVRRQGRPLDPVSLMPQR
jgi:lipoprotein NlpD